MGAERLAIIDPVLLLGLLAGCALLIYFGRVEIAAGIYCATQQWAYALDVGPTVWLWVWVFTLGASAVVFYLRQPSLTRPRSLLDREVPGIVAWGAFWIFWLLVSWYSSPNTYATGLMKNIFTYNLLSFIAISLFGSDLSRVKAFAFAFIGATLISGMVAIPPLPELSYQIQTSTFHLRGVDQVSYLDFAVPFAIASVFLLVFASQTTRQLYRVLAVAAIVFCVFCLLLTGARQSILAVLAAWAIFILWALRRKRFSRRSALAALALSLLVVMVLYSQTALASRWTGPEANLEDLGGRTEIWQAAWNVFLRSPLWGSGLDYFGAGYGAHDLWLDALAGQGIIGFILLNGFLVAVLRFARGTWAGIGSDDLAGWRMGAFCVLVYALVQAIAAGQVAGMPHLFWISALIWRLSVAAQRDGFSDATMYSLRVPASRLARVSTSDGNVRR